MPRPQKPKKKRKVIVYDVIFGEDQEVTMAKVVSMTMSIPDVEIWINYNINNLRITTVEWSIPVGSIQVHVWIWNTSNLVYDRVVNGPASGSENVPGNITLVQKQTPDGILYWWLPDYLTFRINVETAN